MSGRPFKQVVKRIAPSAVEWYHGLRGKSEFSGRYETWKEAMEYCTGFDASSIPSKVREALLKVKTGSAAGERDSVLFDTPQYSWPVLAGILWALSTAGERMYVLDFGGSLGSHYFQYRSFLDDVADLRWNVVEQPRFVDEGKRHFEDNRLRFYSSVQECIRNGHPHVALLSNVLQYLEAPHDFLDEFTRLGIRFIIIDRTAFIDEPRDRLTVQRVPASIYSASYPAWFFSRAGFLAHFSELYELVAEYDDQVMVNVPSTYRGFLFKLRTRP